MVYDDDDDDDYVCTSDCMCVYNITQAYVCMRARIYIYIYAHLNTHACMHTYMQLYT